MKIAKQNTLYYEIYENFNSSKSKDQQIYSNATNCYCNKIESHCEPFCCCDLDCSNKNDLQNLCLDQKEQIETSIQFCNQNQFEDNFQLHIMTNFFKDDLSRISIFCLDRVNLQYQSIQKQAPSYLDQKQYIKTFLNEQSKFYMMNNYVDTKQKIQSMLKILLIKFMAVIINY